MIRLTRERGFDWRVTKGKDKEELAKFLGVDLVYNQDWRPPSSPQRPDNDVLRLLVNGEEDHCGGCYKNYLRTTILETNTNEEFKFHTKKNAYAALGTERKKTYQVMGFFCRSTLS